MESTERRKSGSGTAKPSKNTALGMDKKGARRRPLKMIMTSGTSIDAVLRMSAKRSARSLAAGVSRLAVSLDRSLASKISEAAASSTGGNVSAWLAEAAQARLRQDAMSDALRVLEETNGKATDEEMDQVRREWLG